MRLLGTSQMSRPEGLSKTDPITDTTLTDLFTFLGHLEYSPDMVEALKDYSPEGQTRLVSVLRTYHLNPKIEDAIWEYWKKRGERYIEDSTLVDDPYVKELLQPIKDRCVEEIDNMWKELGIC